MIELMLHDSSIYLEQTIGVAAVKRASVGRVKLTTIGMTYRVVEMDNRLVLSTTSGGDPNLEEYEAGTVSIGDKIIVDGTVYVITARPSNTPVLVEEKA